MGELRQKLHSQQYHQSLVPIVAKEMSFTKVHKSLTEMCSISGVKTKVKAAVASGQQGNTGRGCRNFKNSYVRTQTPSPEQILATSHRCRQTHCSCSKGPSKTSHSSYQPVSKLLPYPTASLRGGSPPKKESCTLT